jgi:monoamine oxidase
MKGSLQFRSTMSALKKAMFLNDRKLPTREGLGRINEAEEKAISRRDLLKAAGFAAVAATPAGVLAKSMAAAPRIAIIGGGLSGLACADRLKAKGAVATVYEASNRLGGRCYSNRTLVNGMAAENGGELIDTGHKAMLGYANRFGLPVESYIKMRGHEAYHFMGQSWPEEEVVDQFRAVVATMQPDLHAISGGATFFDHTPADEAYDNTDLESYFTSRTSGFPLIRAVLDEAYVAEYGRETHEQSALNFLGFMRLNKQSKFEPFGVSDERYHVRNGNDAIAAGLASELPGQIMTGARLTRLGKNASGKYLLYFNGSSVPETADAVVIAIPFSVLRGIQLDASLGLSADKRRAIDTLGYSMNAKTMVAFNGRPWEELHGNGGGIYTDLPNAQNTWETNRANSTANGLITDYASGDRALALRTNKVQQQVDAFLTDFNTVLPGTKAWATKVGGNYVAHMEHWPTNPLALGAYTCYTVGQFTTVAGLEGVPAGQLKFAGEHADSFYSWQGYMEGACLSGIRAANEVLADIKAGLI